MKRCFPYTWWLSALIVTLWCALAVLPGSAYDLKDNAIEHARAGQLLMERERYAEAAEEFKAALRLNPYTPMSAALYNNLGMAYRRMRNYPLAYASFQHAFRIQPTYALYYKNLIEAYAEAGRLSQVENQLKAVLRGNPTNAEAWFLLGLTYQQDGNIKAAKTCFSQFLKLEPESGLAPAARNAL